jgi:pimeloyl-ACP methyl ester carboxylesterase
MCGRSSSVKEQTLPHYAQLFADGGYCVLTFDSRTFGESEGEPRCYYDPGQIVSDYGNAVSYLLTRPDIAEDRIALVGVCMGGGYAVSTAARDKRVAAVASIGGGFDIGGTFLASLGGDGFAGLIRQLNELATKEYQTGEVQYIPAIAPDLSGGLAFMPNAEALSYYDRTSRADAPNWENRVAARSLPAYFAYNAVADAPLVAPTPLLIVHGTVDLFLWPEFASGCTTRRAATSSSTGSRRTTTSSSTTRIPTSARWPRTSSAGSTRGRPGRPHLRERQSRIILCVNVLGEGVV